MRPGNGQEILQSQGTNQHPPQQNRVLQQLQQGDWRLQQLHHLHHHQQQPPIQDAYIQQVWVKSVRQVCKWHVMLVNNTLNHVLRFLLLWPAFFLLGERKGSWLLHLPFTFDLSLHRHCNAYPRNLLSLCCLVFAVRPWIPACFESSLCGPNKGFVYV